MTRDILLAFIYVDSPSRIAIKCFIRVLALILRICGGLYLLGYHPKENPSVNLLWEIMKVVLKWSKFRGNDANTYRNFGRMKEVLKCSHISLSWWDLFFSSDFFFKFFFFFFFDFDFFYFIYFFYLFIYLFSKFHLAVASFAACVNFL